MQSRSPKAERDYVKLPTGKWLRGRGFTLIELLVVITIIAMLAAILLPSLARAKDQAKKINCISNLHQLQVCWHLYVDDYGQVLPPNDDISTGNSGEMANMEQLSWCEGQPRIDTNTANIQAGLLFPYNRQTAIYHCPSDLSTVDGGVQLRNRSYNMSQSVNGLGSIVDPSENVAVDVVQPCFLKLAEIHNPSPSQAFVFIDESEATMWDAQFGYPMPNYDSGVWWDMPANRHEQGADLSFADGHVEYWHWRVPMLFTLPPGDIGQSVAPGQQPDYNRVGNAMLIQAVDLNKL
ncbi:MAG TPA: type II secretion system protein [Verrucomicrobiae bacterium]|jgi:prepilin-type N-terminal cleavage/methylation domain-containing protein/prepilin-type processing-associated H-X9-DG protein|nr:type II secretion system protein [Verrucomicrobiae bacterium]